MKRIIFFSCFLLFLIFSFLSKNEKQADNVIAVFLEGEQLAIEKKPLNSCFKRKKQNSVFCLEGFFFASIKATLKNHKTPIAQTYKDIPEELKNVWAVALGITYAYLKRELSEAKFLKNKTPILYSYFIDGLALSWLHLYGWKKTQTLCESLEDHHLKSACYWGAGRSYFIHMKTEKKSIPDESINGFVFASHFTHLNLLSFEKIKNLKNGSAQVAELTKHLFSNNLPKDLFLQKMVSCLKQKHMSQCF